VIRHAILRGGGPAGPRRATARRPAPIVRSAAVALAAVLVLAAALVLTSCRATTRAARTASRRSAGPIAAEPSWSRPVPLGPSDLAADSDGVVVLSGNRRVTAINREGREQWTRTVDGAGVNLDPPALDRRRVAVGASDRLVVLDRADGALRWQADVPKEVGVAAFAHPRGGEDLVVTSTYTGDLEARTADDGTPRWKVSRPGEVRARLAFGSGDRTVVAMWSETGRSVLRALDVTTGDVLWERALEIGTSAPVVTRGFVVIGTGDGSYHAAVETFALADGAPGPQVPVPASFEPELEPAVDGDDVVVVDQLGTVTALDPVAGVERWHADLGEAVLRTRVVAGARVVLSTAAGAVVWLERGTGRVVRRLGSDSAYARQLAGRPGQVVVAYDSTSPERVDAYPL
jgi:outer membrane protein assembly factor BamB